MSLCSIIALAGLALAPTVRSANHPANHSPDAIQFLYHPARKSPTPAWLVFLLQCLLACVLFFGLRYLRLWIVGRWFANHTRRTSQSSVEMNREHEKVGKSGGSSIINAEHSAEVPGSKMRSKGSAGKAFMAASSNCTSQTKRTGGKGSWPKKLPSRAGSGGRLR